MIVESDAFSGVCPINFRVVYENLTDLQSDLLFLKKIFESIQEYVRVEALSEATADIEVIQSLFDKLEQEIPELLEKCHQEPLDEDFWKEARHDLRASVGAIKSYAELLGEDLAEQISQNLKQALHQLISKVQNILPIITKITPESSFQDIPQASKMMRLGSQSKSAILGRILIIDDDPQKRNILRRHLESMGHTIFESPSGAAALKALQPYQSQDKEVLFQISEHPGTRHPEKQGFHLIKDRTIESDIGSLPGTVLQEIDLILLDILMPEMSGHEVLDILKQKKDIKDIPVLVISSLRDLDSVVRCIDAGADDYLEIPVDPVLLNARVNACLEKKAAADRHKKQSEELEKARNTLYAAMESIEDGFAIFDTEEHLIMYNTAFSNMYPSVEILGGEGLAYSDFINKNIELGRYFFLETPQRNLTLRGPQFYGSLPEYRRRNDLTLPDDWLKISLEHFRNGKEPQEVQLSDDRWIEVVNAPILAGGTVSLHKDITQRQRRESEAQRRADYDGLTGLANRSYFDQLLQKAFQYTLAGGEPFALMFFDLDGFKKVNDDLGHEFGDLVLTDVSKKLKKSFRETDIVARLGGDEFCALAYEVHEKAFLRKIANRCLNAVGTFVESKGVRANFGISIGISIFPGDANTPEELLASADAAMYDAKKSGKGTFRFFSEL